MRSVSPAPSRCGGAGAGAPTDQATAPDTTVQPVSGSTTAVPFGPAVPATPTPAATPKPPRMSDEQVRQAVLNYMFTMANDNPQGTDVIGRQGDIVRVATRTRSRVRASGPSLTTTCPTGR